MAPKKKTKASQLKVLNQVIQVIKERVDALLEKPLRKHTGENILVKVKMKRTTKMTKRKEKHVIKKMKKQLKVL